MPRPQRLFYPKDKKSISETHEIIKKDGKTAKPDFTKNAKIIDRTY